jgi:hypothetical protein
MPDLITTPELLQRLRHVITRRRARGASDEEIETLELAERAIGAGGSERPPEEARLLGGHIPAWWADDEVRGLVVRLHGRQTLDRALAGIRAQVGERAPSRSSLHRVWQRLSRAAGAPTGPRQRR